MSRLSKLLGKSQDFTIGGEVFTLTPLTIEELPLLMSASSTNLEAQGRALGQIIRKTLKKAVPDATTEELDGIAFNYFEELTNAVMTVNGLDKAKVADALRKGQEVKR